MELTRKQVIEILDLIKKQYQPFNINQQRLICALDYAISSLKTDEAYQIMYEGREVFTKADMVAMLTDIQLEIEEIDLKDSDPNYQKGAEEAREYISNMIEERIDKLKEAKDGENSIGDNPCGNC